MKKIIPTIVCRIAFLLAITTLSAQDTQNITDLKYEIDSYLSKGVSNGFSGSIFIVKEDHILLNKGYGMADKENNISYMPNTVAPIGSVTKQFTATAILKLVELNKINLTDPLSNFFKDIPKDKKDITIHQLLTHSAGLIDGIGEGDFDNIPMEKYFKTLLRTKLLHHPGSQYAYSNAGYSILARIIELASGQDYEHFLNKYLFKPAGMKQTGYFIPQWNDSLVAKGYAHSFVNIGTMISRYQKMGNVTWGLKGNGGIHSTTKDMYKWYKALKSNKILSKSSFEKLTTPYIIEQAEGISHYAYGWAIYESENNTKIISHNGGNGIFFHDFIWIPEDKILIILFTNAGSKEAEVAWSIKKMIFSKKHQVKKIKKNLHLLVFDFIRNNNLQKVNELNLIIKKEYSMMIKNPNYLNGLGYDILKNRLKNTPYNVEWALEVFKLNVELFPTNGNIWDSLAEGYLYNGQNEQAIKCYKKALDLAPVKDCTWCKNSNKALKKLMKIDE